MCTLPWLSDFVSFRIIARKHKTLKTNESLKKNETSLSQCREGMYLSIQELFQPSMFSMFHHLQEFLQVLLWLKREDLLWFLQSLYCLHPVVLLVPTVLQIFPQFKNLYLEKHLYFLIFLDELHQHLYQLILMLHFTSVHQIIFNGRLCLFNIFLPHLMPMFHLLRLPKKPYPLYQLPVYLLH